MDDEIQILENTPLHDLSNWFSYFTSSTMGSSGAASMGGIYYKPIMTSFFAIVWAIAGAEPWAFRLPLLIIFVVNAFFVYRLSLRSMSLRASFFAGFLFLLHPVNTEIVYYIADAQDVLYMFFGLASLVIISETKGSMGLISTLALFLTLAAAILSKETGALFLLFTIAWCHCFCRNKLKNVVAVSLTVAVGYAILRWSIQLVHTGNEQLLFHHATFIERLKMLPFILAHYAEIIVWPDRLSLATDFVIRDINFEFFYRPVLILTAAVSVTGLMIRSLWRDSKVDARPMIQFFTVVLVGWFGLHSHIFVPLDGVYCDRWLVLVVWAFVSLVLLFTTSWLRKQSATGQTKLKVLATIIALLIAVLFAARSFVRGQDWRTPIQLYRHELTVNPWDILMLNNVGVMLFREGRPFEAEPYFRESAKGNPYWSVAINNLGAVEERRGNTLAAQRDYEEAIARSFYPLSYENYARLLFNTRQYDKCREFTASALLRLPYNATLRAIQAQLPPPTPSAMPLHE